MKLNGEMLVLAREFRGLTQEQAAELVGCAQSTIAKIEGGLKGDIDDELANKIADQLQFPVDFFQQPDQLLGFGSSAYYYRKKVTIPASERKKVHGTVNLLRIALKQLLRQVEISPSKPLPQLDLDMYEKDPAQAARALRIYWNLPDGPIRNITSLLESAGVIVIPCDFGTKAIDATCLRLAEMPPLIFINHDIPGDRWRFTLAHELAHLVLHDVPHDSMEAEADAFAAEFLVPEAELSLQLMQRGKIRLGDFLPLKRYWRVSIQSLILGAERCGQLTAQQVRYFYAQMSRANMRTNEPEPIEREQASSLRKIIDAMLGPLEFDEEDLAELVKWNKSEVRQFLIPQRIEAPRLRIVR
jgi:Zn-dependent peptidase ImmA (M78 family)/DNA-binding XRE family transcriptional regulator